MLLLVQTKNFWSNTTTNERYSRTSRIQISTIERSDSDTLVNRESKLRNIAEMCCNLDQSTEVEVQNRQNDENDIRYTWIVNKYESLKKPLLE